MKITINQPFNLSTSNPKQRLKKISRIFADTNKTGNYEAHNNVTPDSGSQKYIRHIVKTL